MKPRLSIIVLSFNTKDLLRDCLRSLSKVRGEVSFEVIVVDNGSIDGSIEMIRRNFNWTRLVENGANLGFAAGNNAAKEFCEGKLILFLNSDTVVPKNTLKETIDYMEDQSDIGALTCKTLLPNGDLDKDARRSFPTPWVSFTHLVLPLDRMFPKSELFSKYWYGHKDVNEIHEVDVVQGAFFLTRKKILDEVGWFDEDYFLDGEDIDLCWKIRSKGYRIMYYPKVSITHVKGASKGKNKAIKRSVDLNERLKYRMSGVNSMEIFYRKHLWNRYALPISVLVLTGIRFVKIKRLLKVLLFR